MPEAIRLDTVAVLVFKSFVVTLVLKKVEDVAMIVDTSRVLVVIVEAVRLFARNRPLASPFTVYNVIDDIVEPMIAFAFCRVV